MTATTMLVNSSHPLPPGWEPDDLVNLWDIRPHHCLLRSRSLQLCACAATAANALFGQAEREGIKDFVLASAYRDGDYQAKLFEDSPNGYVAYPGCSEHQTGLAMDVAQFRRGMNLDDEHRAWLAENCWEHGFVIRYPQGRQDVTGIPFEPWHLRYVGRDVAGEMRQRGWVLEEWHEAHREG